MSYRIVEGQGGRVDDRRVIRSFDSAYSAVAFMKRAFHDRGERPPPWYLLDPNAAVLVAPLDLYDVAA